MNKLKISQAEFYRELDRLRVYTRIEWTPEIDAIILKTRKKQPVVPSSSLARFILKHYGFKVSPRRLRERTNFLLGNPE